MLYVYVLEKPRIKELPDVFISPVDFGEEHILRLPRVTSKYKLILKVKRGEKLDLSGINLPEDIKKKLMERLKNLGVL